jgi:hypothetical protein
VIFVQRRIGPEPERPVDVVRPAAEHHDPADQVGRDHVEAAGGGESFDPV